MTSYSSIVMKSLFVFLNSFSSGARCLIFDWILCQRPYFMCVTSKGSGKTARMRRLALAFAGRLCDKYHNAMSWLISWPVSTKVVWPDWGLNSRLLDGSQISDLHHRVLQEKILLSVMNPLPCLKGLSPVWTIHANWTFFLSNHYH